MPGVTFSGFDGSLPPATQPTFNFVLSTPYPITINGSLVLTFKGDDGSDDPAIQFSTAGRTLPFTIPANTTVPVFSISGIALATGTTAGLITLTAHFQAAGDDITANPAPTQRVIIPPSAPAITDLKATRSGNTITVVVTGFASAKQVLSATFTFAPATGANFQTTVITQQMDQIFKAYYGAAASSGFGSQFTYTQTFTVSGDPAAIGSVTVVLLNSIGSSPSVKVTIQ